MTNERYHQIMDEDSPLTKAERDEGWHFCPEMDGLLANANEPNGDCFCSLNLQRFPPTAR